MVDRQSTSAENWTPAFVLQYIFEDFDTLYIHVNYAAMPSDIKMEQFQQYKCRNLLYKNVIPG